MEFPPEHYFETATERMRQACKEQARVFLNSAQKFIEKGGVLWRIESPRS